MTLDVSRIKKLALAVRTLSIDAVEKANSGHPGLPLGAADFASTLWSRYLRFNPKDPQWINRDRFVLSAGHGCMLWYSLLHLFGFNLPLTELQRFRQWESKTPGHPEFGFTPGIETTTGPLGQGSANAVGIALSAKLLARDYGSDLFDYRVFALVSDGDLMEGISGEAASFAGHLGLDNLIYLYDDNKISLAGETDVCFTEAVAKRYESYGWFAQSCDGHNIEQVAQCLDRALAEKGRPSIICCRTLLGYGSPHKANTHEAHGSPLGKDEVKATKKNLGSDENRDFYVSEETAQYCAEQVAEKVKGYDTWVATFNAWKKQNPQAAARLTAQLSRELPTELKSELIAAFKEGKKDATRNLSGAAIQVIAKRLPGFIGGSADLEPSTKTTIKGSPDIQRSEFGGRNIRYGVREHAMGAIANGLAYQQCWFPLTSTFLVFSDYMRPTIRLAAISHLQTLFVFTHDSFWVGEDGPTHEPIEHIAALRAIPHLFVFRPADGLEVAMSYFAALELKNAPSTLLFTRQNVAPLVRSSGAGPDDILKGGYIVSGHEQSSLVICATGSEVALAVDAAKLLSTRGINARIVSLPCLELFRKQDASYRDHVIPPGARKVSIEAGITMGWREIVGTEGLPIGIDHFGASAPGEVLADKFGFTPEKIADRIERWWK